MHYINSYCYLALRSSERNYERDSIFSIISVLKSNLESNKESYKPTSRHFLKYLPIIKKINSICYLTPEKKKKAN